LRKAKPRAKTLGPPKNDTKKKEREMKKVPQSQLAEAT
jgi:hypothetical protein